MSKHIELKKHLSAVFVLEDQICKLLERLEQLRCKQTNASQGFSRALGTSVKQSLNYRQAEDLSVYAMELETELKSAKTELAAFEKEIHRLSVCLSNPVFRAIINWRYICRLKWKDIAKRIEMSEMQIMREHNLALKDMLSITKTI